MVVAQDEFAVSQRADGLLEAAYWPQVTPVQVDPGRQLDGLQPLARGRLRLACMWTKRVGLRQLSFGQNLSILGGAFFTIFAHIFFGAKS